MNNASSSLIPVSRNKSLDGTVFLLRALLDAWREKKAEKIRYARE
jgi:hypothetical protein